MRPIVPIRAKRWRIQFYQFLCDGSQQRSGNQCYENAMIQTCYLCCILAKYFPSQLYNGNACYQFLLVVIYPALCEVGNADTVSIVSYCWLARWEKWSTLFAIPRSTKCVVGNFNSARWCSSETCKASRFDPINRLLIAYYLYYWLKHPFIMLFQGFQREGREYHLNARKMKT